MSEELKPVAWMYTHWGHPKNRTPASVGFARVEDRLGEGWTETPLYSADQIAAMQEEITRLRADLAMAVSEVSKWAAQAGEAKGKLEASEMSGVVDSWRAKCEAVEADKAGLVALVREALTECERSIRLSFTLQQRMRATLAKHGAGDA